MRCKIRTNCSSRRATVTTRGKIYDPILDIIIPSPCANFISQTQFLETLSSSNCTILEWLLGTESIQAHKLAVNLIPRSLTRSEQAMNIPRPLLCLSLIHSPSFLPLGNTIPRRLVLLASPSSSLGFERARVFPAAFPAATFPPRVNSRARWCTDAASISKTGTAHAGRTRPWRRDRVSSMAIAPLQENRRATLPGEKEDLAREERNGEGKKGETSRAASSEGTQREYPSRPPISAGRPPQVVPAEFCENGGQRRREKGRCARILCLRRANLSRVTLRRSGSPLYPSFTLPLFASVPWQLDFSGPLSESTRFDQILDAHFSRRFLARLTIDAFPQ